MTGKELTDCMAEEIQFWRRNFLETKFLVAFRHIPDGHKHQLSAYFMSIPFASFSSPEREWDNCLSTLLQTLGDK